MSRSNNSEQQILKHLNRLEEQITLHSLSNPEVSQVDVGWHLAHSFKVINQIYAVVKESDPAKYRWLPNPLRVLVWKSGKMKRGAGKAPDSVLPSTHITEDSLRQQLAEARGSIVAFNDLPERGHMRHFAFGTLKRDDALRFVEIHTNHHLQIMLDIVSKAEE